MDRTLTGPRYGLTYVTGEAFSELKNFYHVSAETLSQVGWLHEFVLRDSQGSYLHLAQAELMISGLEGHVALPSLSALYLLRTADNTDFGMGIHVGAFGTGIVFDLGKAFDMGGNRIPIQFLLKQYSNGTELSLNFSVLTR